MIFRKHFGHFYIKYLAFFLIGIAVLVTINYLQLEIPRNLNRIITRFENDQIIISEALDYVVPIIQTLSIYVMGIVVGRFIWRYTLFGTARRIEEDLRNNMFTHATKLPQSYFSAEKTGGLMTLFTNDLEAVRQSYGMGLLMLVDGLVLGGLVLVRMFSIHWMMTLFAFIPLAIVAVIILSVLKKMEAKFKARQEAIEELSDFTQENFSGISVIKAYVKESHEKSVFKSKTDEVFQKDMGYIKYSIVINIALGFTILLIATSIIIYGSILIARTHHNIGSFNMTPGLLTEYVSYFFSLIWPVLALAQFFFVNGQAQASSKRIAKFLDAKVTIFDQESANLNIPQLSGAITIKDLTFQYPDGDSPVLDQINFTINKGEMVGILGRTGSGKSSLVELLLRVYNTPSATIFFDEHDMLDIPIKQLRDHIGYVPQDNFLYSDTIANNIGFAYQNPSEEIVIQAAKLSDVYDNITEFKEGFQTVLGERGVTVSGGQKQRISIARALAKDPQILILDDSVSAVDTKTEEAIISNLKKVRKNKTTIIIAHRISTVKKMDKIILLDKGKVVAVGSHNQLIKSTPLYQDMVKRQELEQLVEEGNHEGL